ncbi:MAG: glycosyltransferase [Clostridiales bacterium]|nr:glycosyltransferase [Clostridiales bacterium]
MNGPFFSVIVVSLNAGSLIGLTIKSALSQTCDDYEIIVKDGKSTDDTLKYVPENGSVKLYSESDKSLYDAMNQAISYSSGRYLIFMNCGDTFASNTVLEEVKNAVKDGEYGMIYGDYVRDGVIKKQPLTLTRFNMYRTILCHQSVFFNGEILRSQKKYDIRYKILADYDLEQDMAKTSNNIHVDTVVCNYIGGGLSETKEGLKQKNKDRRDIIASHYSVPERMKYCVLWKMTFPTIRRKISESRNEKVRKRYQSLVNRIND